MSLLLPKAKHGTDQRHAPSILQNAKECYITRKLFGVSCTVELEQHHIYFGSRNRSISEAYGFWVYIRHRYHRGSTEAVHCRDGRELDQMLKQDCQRAYEAAGHSRAEFIALIGESYL